MSVKFRALDVVEKRVPRTRKVNPLIDAVSMRLSLPKYATILAGWQKSLDRLNSDPDGAITAARSLMESSCKLILESTQIEYGINDDLPKLYGAASLKLGIAASLHTDRIFRSIFGSAHNIVQSVGELRNKMGDAHGKGMGSLAVSKVQAELAVNLAGSIVLFLISSLEKYIASNHRVNSNNEAILKFDKATVWRLVDHARNSPKSSASYGKKKATPALWLVGDAGIYLMSNGHPPISYRGRVAKEGEEVEIPYLTAPAEGCDPRYDEFENWWPVHGVVSEGSDFSITIPIGRILKVLEYSKNQIIIVVGASGYSIYSDTSYDQIQ